ncbi:DUF349 domain-containing protein [Corynebacterium confusum]|uniref:DUF349 domain-containing protein n=1 Tax=uncultured Corynebacterium sp. TaxID=159447 RepID=UPI0025F3FF57|nr:DUF349 domain-containing protein [uncultured Corynebacterium sp.]
MAPQSQVPHPGNMPKPGPRPQTPKPGQTPRPGAQPAAPVALSQTPKSDPTKWGRVAADGTVYVTTGDGERAVGSWQAGTAAEGLAHFGKRYADLATEVELLEARLKANPQEADSIKDTAATLRADLATAAVVGDLDALDKRLAAIMDHSAAAREKAQADKAERRAAAIAGKEKLAAEAEEIAENSTEWKAAGDRIRAILDEWKTIKGIDRKTDDQLWKRYSRARDAFNRRRGSHFAELDRSRAAARKKKEELVERAEALQNSTDWGPTARAYRDLMQEWKAAGRAPRDVDDRLWAQFRAAQDHFFNARNQVNAERDKEFAANAQAKDALLAEYYPQIDPAANLNSAKAKLRELQEKWEEIGFVPRNQIREYEDKIAEVEKRVSDAEESQWRRTDPEAQARVDQFRSRAQDFNQQADAAAAKGNTQKEKKLRAQAEQWEQWAQTAAAVLDEQ